MLQIGIIEVEVFDVWGIDLMRPFSIIALPTNDTKTIVRFLKKNILSRLGTPRALVNDNVM
ncbi:reverse transcriptase [Gossypium australe]|uniref:Reverse transcriptase n=1 Tax=Gossypium australe TaxID=47621 RepID=A0A5B6WR92_9ROSI|nr:reverse transcriptase [Gossypium australe]